jgi:Holliday junction resolvase
MNSVKIGRMFEEKAKGILINEGYEIIEESSKINWRSPYDLTAKKGNKIYLIEVRGKNSKNNTFGIKKKKLDRLRKFKKDIIILCINDYGYELIFLKEFNKNVTRIQLEQIIIRATCLSDKIYDPIFKQQCPICERLIKAHSPSQLGYSMKLHQEVHKRIKPQIEPKLMRISYFETCPFCKEDIKGFSVSNVKYNLRLHQEKCKKLSDQNKLKKEVKPLK